MTGALFALLTASSSKTPSSSGSTTFIIFLVLIAVVGYFLLIRPQKMKQRRQRQQQQEIGVGDEILTVGGIVGKVVALDADRVTILTGGETVGFAAVGSEPTRIVLVRNAIARKVEPALPDAPGDASEEDSNGTGDFDGAGGFDGHLDSHMNGHDSTLGGSSTKGAESESEGTSP